jgi:hypothetical protein
VTTGRRAAVVVAGFATAAVGAWATARVLERVMVPHVVQQREQAPPLQPPPAPVAHITATLFYASRDGRYLEPFRREIPLATGPVEQGKQIVTAQLQPAPPGAVSTIPAGTALRAFYVTEGGEAFVDLSAEATRNHPGGSTNELFTVYAIVNAITTNLPALSRVQILIDGKEVDTLAGHVDLRRPLQNNRALLRPERKTP